MTKIIIERYEREMFPFERAMLLLNKEPRFSVDKQKQILRQLGTEAIAINADWLLSVGERELTLPR